MITIKKSNNCLESSAILGIIFELNFSFYGDRSFFYTSQTIFIVEVKHKVVTLCDLRKVNKYSLPML